MSQAPPCHCLSVCNSAPCCIHRSGDMSVYSVSGHLSTRKHPNSFIEGESQDNLPVWHAKEAHQDQTHGIWNAWNIGLNIFSNTVIRKKHKGRQGFGPPTGYLTKTDLPCVSPNRRSDTCKTCDKSPLIGPEGDD